MVIQEEELLKLLSGGEDVSLVEPNYKRKYLPLGLAKISTFVKDAGGNVVYGRGFKRKSDLYCVSTLWTYEYPVVLKAIRSLLFFDPKAVIVVGGVLASLMPKKIEKISSRVKVFKGYSKTLDMCVPDYSIDWGIDEEWSKYSFSFTSRGCPNKCAYCAVWKIEPDVWINPVWREVLLVEGKPNVMVSDNNLSACPENHIEEVVRFLIDKKKKVVFDNGFDCKHVTDEFAEMFSDLRFARKGMRLAFDRIEEDGVFQKAVEKLLKAGVSGSDILVYVLFNFTDTPKEADYRMRECLRLGVHPYPQMYVPLNKLSRNSKYIGKHWTENLTRAFRHFWLMSSYNTKLSFEEYAKDRSKCAVRLDKRDWEAWQRK